MAGFDVDVHELRRLSQLHQKAVDGIESSIQHRPELSRLGPGVAQVNAILDVSQTEAALVELQMAALGDALKAAAGDYSAADAAQSAELSSSQTILGPR